jgi:drug/metabolite transporter (DMT)-like permease
MDTSQDRFAQWAPALFVLLWSTGFVGAKFGLPFAEPFTFLLLRYGVVTVILGAILLLWRLPLPRTPAMWGHLAITGLLLHGFYVGGVFVAIAHGMSSGIAALVVGIQPLLTAGVAGPMLGERVSRRQMAGLVLGFAGLALTVSKTFTMGELPGIGLLACIVALLAITFGTVYQKRHVVGVDLRAGAFVQFLATALVFALLALAFDTREVDWNPKFLFALGWLCLALSLGAISLLWRLIQRGAAAKVASLFYLVPPVTAVEGYLLFGESLTWLQMIGIAVTALGVAIINRG